MVHHAGGGCRMIHGRDHNGRDLDEGERDEASLISNSVSFGTESSNVFVTDQISIEGQNPFRVIESPRKINKSQGQSLKVLSDFQYFRSCFR
jgi:hypothetical protein